MEINSEYIFGLGVTLTLTFDLSTPKPNQFIVVCMFTKSVSMMKFSRMFYKF